MSYSNAMEIYIQLPEKTFSAVNHSYCLNLIITINIDKNTHNKIHGLMKENSGLCKTVRLLFINNEKPTFFIMLVIGGYHVSNGG